MTIPNTKIATSVVHNYSMPNPQVRIQIPVSVSFGADIEYVRRVLQEITDEAIKSRPDMIAPNPEPVVYLLKMEKSILTFTVTVYASGFMYNNGIQDYMNTRIIERFRKEGIALI